MLILLYGAVILLLATACNDLSQDQSDQINKALKDSLVSTTQTWDIDMKLLENGHKKIHLRGSYAATFDTNNLNETRISGPVSIQVFDTTAAIKTWVDSDSAIYRAEKSQFELFGDVHVRSRSKRHLKSEYLKWDQSKNKISTPQFVIITTPTDSIAGTGFDGTTDLSSYRIKKPSGRVFFK